MSRRADLNALILFYEVVNAGSISAAALKLSAPKSTISRKISVLEHQVNARLLVRGARQCSLTEVGKVIYDHAQRVVTELESAGMQATEFQTALNGILRISLPVDFGVAWLSRLIADFAAAHPDIRLALDINNRWVDITEERYDISLHLTPPNDPNLPVRRFSSLSRGIYAAPAYLKNVPRLISREDLARADVVTTTHQIEEGLWHTVLCGDDDDTSRRNLQLREPRCVANNIGVARELVLAGLGVAILTSVMCRNDVATGRLVQLFPEWECPKLHAYATHLGRTRVPRKIRVFVDFLSTYLMTDQ